MNEAVTRSGYPLQLRAATQLMPTFSVVEEWAYIDRDAQKPRSLDLWAYLSLATDPESPYHPELVLLIECKRSELPFVFFAAARPLLSNEYPSLFGFRRTTFGVQVGQATREVPPSAFLALSEFSFVSAGPPISRAFAKADRSGKDLDISGEVPFRAVLLPLASALHHWADMRKVEADRQRYFPSLTLMLCVLDAPMVLVRGIAQAPELVLQPWVRVVRQESSRDHAFLSYRHYVVDFVHIDYLATFLSDHLLPFAGQVATRIQEARPNLPTGRWIVKDWDSWTWADVMPKHT
jgi:hypothetical protein